MAFASSARVPLAGLTPAEASSGGAGDALVERLRQLASGGCLPEARLEPALRAVLETVGVSAGALCLFEQRREMLRVATHVQLSEEGVRQLGCVRRGGFGSWDMPLQSLLNRRVYLIENAARNRYVPALVESAASMRTIACLPLYAGATPVGSVILAALAPQLLTERDLQRLDAPLRELARMVQAAWEADAGAPTHDVPPVVPPVATAGASASRDEVEALGARLKESEGERGRLGEELARVRAEAEATIGRLRDEGERRRAEATAAAERERALVAERARLEDDLAAAAAAAGTADAARASLAQELAGLRTRTAAELARLATRLEELTAERDRLAAAAARGGMMQERSGPAAALPPALEDTAVARAAGAPDAIPPGETVIVDDHPAWAEGAPPGAVVVGPRTEVAALVAAAPSAVLANLSMPRALEILGGLRAAGSTVPLWGFIGAPSAGDALPLGRVELAARSLDADALTVAVAAHGASGTRVVTAGADVDGLVGLRQALSRRGMSVSMAWNGKQVDDLLPMVRPQVVVVDLGLPLGEGWRIASRVAGRDPAPTLVLLVGPDDPVVPAAAILGDPGLRERLVERRGLLAIMHAPAVGADPSGRDAPAPARGA
jgi:hypothetical protein